jgi:hypothetical protein
MSKTFMVETDYNYEETEGDAKNTFLKVYKDEIMLVLTFNQGKQLCKMTRRLVKN